MRESLVGIQVLRFVAAMLVVVMHLTQAYSLHILGEDGRLYWSQGSAGVDIFFVISGLVMGLSTPPPAPTAAQRWRQARIFMGRRLLRVVPLYWFYTLLKAALLLALPSLALRYSMAPQHLLDSLLFVPAISPWGRVEPTLPVGWTLNFEMLFYAIFAAAVALGAPRLLFALAAFGLVFLAQAWQPDSVVLGFWGQSLVFEFILGLGIAKAHQRLKQNVPEAGLLALALGVVLMFGLPWQPDDDRLGSWGLAAALIVAGAVWLEPWTQRLRLGQFFLPKDIQFSAPEGVPPPAALRAGARARSWTLLGVLVFLGDASYSIYLSHTFVVPAAMQAARRLGGVDGAWLMPAVALLVVAVGCLSHLWLERPLTRVLKNLLTPSAPSSPKPESSHAKP